jgi:hypothetical protein
MPEIRVFNPSSYTPRSYFARQGEEGRSQTMAHKNRRHRHGRRHNPLGISGSVIKDAGLNTAGALGSLWLGSLFSQTGWAGVGVTGAAAVAAFFGGKMVMGAPAAEEILKGGLTATIIRALHQAGIASNIGLGMYAPSYFAVPTSSTQYLQNAAPGMQFRRGNGTIYFPGPGTPALPPAPPATGGSGMGFHRFRSRYAGNY